MRLTKKRKYILKNINHRNLSINDSLFFLKKYSLANFNESIDIHIKLSDEFISHRKIIKGFIYLPYTLLKFKKVLIFAEGSDIDLIKNFSFYNIGVDSLAAKIINGFTDFNVILSTFNFSNKLKELYNYLPVSIKNLIPIYEDNIITDDLKESIKKLKIDKINFKTDKFGCISFSIGKSNFNHECLKLNFFEVLNFLKINKPNYIKKNLINSINLSSTMGVGINVILDNIF